MGNPFLITIDVTESVLLNGAREFYRPSEFLGTASEPFPCDRILLPTPVRGSSRQIRMKSKYTHFKSTSQIYDDFTRSRTFWDLWGSGLFRGFRRLGLEWVFGPGVFRISAAEVLANLVIGRGPEAFQIIGDLHGAIVWTEQVEEYGNSSMGQARGFGPTEKFLERTARIGGRPGS